MQLVRPHGSPANAVTCAGPIFFLVLLCAGKLFPGPHLFAGAAIVALWALAAALVPAMQKGNQNARNAHIALNALNVGLFIWQVSHPHKIYMCAAAAGCSLDCDLSMLLTGGLMTNVQSCKSSCIN